MRRRCMLHEDGGEHVVALQKMDVLVRRSCWHVDTHDDEQVDGERADGVFANMLVFLLIITFIQGCSANSYDGNRQKTVRISQLVRISRTMYVKFFDKIMDFSSRISDNF